MSDWFWWLDESNYFFLIIWTIPEFIYLFYINRKAKHILGTPYSRLPFMNKTFNNIRYVVLAFTLLVLFSAVVKIINGANTWIIIYPIIFYLTYNIFYTKLNQFNYNDNGIILFPSMNSNTMCIEALKWDSITKLAVDKDINQKVYGFWIYTQSLKNPGRFWVDRKYINQVIELFKKYNVCVEERN